MGSVRLGRRRGDARCAFERTASARAACGHARESRDSASSSAGRSSSTRGGARGVLTGSTTMMLTLLHLLASSEISAISPKQINPRLRGLASACRRAAWSIFREVSGGSASRCTRGGGGSARRSTRKRRSAVCARELVEDGAESRAGARRPAALVQRPLQLGECLAREGEASPISAESIRKCFCPSTTPSSSARTARERGLVRVAAVGFRSAADVTQAPPSCSPISRRYARARRERPPWQRA